MSRFRSERTFRDGRPFRDRVSFTFTPLGRFPPSIFPLEHVETAMFVCFLSEIGSVLLVQPEEKRKRRLDFNFRNFPHLPVLSIDSPPPATPLHFRHFFRLRQAWQRPKASTIPSSFVTTFVSLLFLGSLSFGRLAPQSVSEHNAELCLFFPLRVSWVFFLVRPPSGLQVALPIGRRRGWLGPSERGLQLPTSTPAPFQPFQPFSSRFPAVFPGPKVKEKPKPKQQQQQQWKCKKKKRKLSFSSKSSIKNLAQRAVLVGE